MSRESIIEVENLTKRFGRFTANDNLTFEVREGEVFGFLGANGAGKTTALRILCGLSKPTSGTVRIAGLDASHHPDRIKKVIGYMCQRFALYEDLTVFENIQLYGGIYGLTPREIRSSSAELLD